MEYPEEIAKQGESCDITETGSSYLQKYTGPRHDNNCKYNCKYAVITLNRSVRLKDRHKLYISHELVLSTQHLFSLFTMELIF